MMEIISAKKWGIVERLLGPGQAEELKQHVQAGCRLTSWIKVPGKKVWIRITWQGSDYLLSYRVRRFGFSHPIFVKAPGYTWVDALILAATASDYCEHIRQIAGEACLQITDPTYQWGRRE